MGTFASLVKLNDGGIPEEKKEEFFRKVCLLFKYGGMMKMKRNEVLGKKFVLLDNDFRIKEGSLNFNYNYFEEDWWENAGFDFEKGRVYSGKIGWKQFNRVMKAAYILENQYRTGTGFVESNADMVYESVYTAWLNYIFKEKNNITNFDLWKLYSSIYRLKDNDKEYYWIGDLLNDEYWRNSGYGFKYISYLEILAVNNCTDSVINDENIISNVEDDRTLGVWLKIIKILMMKNLNKFRLDTAVSDDEQFEILKQLLHSYYRNEDATNVKFHEDKTLKYIYASLSISKSPVFLIKKMSEIYNKDFWELYDEFESLYDTDRCGEEILNLSAENYWVGEITTSDFLKADVRKMLLFWNEDDETDEEMETWFSDMKNIYMDILKEDSSDFNLLEYIPGLLEYISKNYRFVYAFECFFSETIKHINDRRYISYWRLLGKLAYSKEFFEIGSVIFEPSKEGDTDRRLINSWEFIPDDLKNNQARQQLKDLMAISANPALRMKIFEF